MARVFLFLSHKMQQCHTTFVPIFLSPKNLFSVTLNSSQIRVFLTLMAGHIISPK